MKQFRHEWVLLLVLAVVSFLVLPTTVFAGEAEASAAIASAKQQIVVSYRAVEVAEAEGANVTSLTLVLDNAGLLLSNAESAYVRSDFDAAFSLATQSRDSLSNVVSEANALGYAALQQRAWDFNVNIVGSGLGALAVILVGAAVWFLLKRRSTVSGEQTDESVTI